MPAAKKSDYKTSEVDFEKQQISSNLSEDELYAQEYGVDVLFVAKVRIINNAINEVGMGRYQWELFISAAFGWAVDNLWLQGNAIILPFIGYEFFDSAESANHAKLATLALYAGLIVGATFWGFSADVLGRRFAFNSTLLGAGIFGIATGAAPSFPVYGVLISLVGAFVGGNLPIDGALFLEFIPESSQYLLTLLSWSWAFGQVVASLISWAFLANYSCPLDDYYTAACNTSNNQGWRYSFYTLGTMCVVLWILRIFVLPMEESPKFLIATGRDADAVKVVQAVAKRNKKQTSLTLEKLTEAVQHLNPEAKDISTKFSTIELLKQSAEIFSGKNVGRLFATRKLAWSMSLIIFIYGALGLAYPLFNGFLGNYLTLRNANLGNPSISDTYATYTYQAACGIGGSVVASIMVLGRFGGRKVAMSICTILSGVFLFSLTATRTSAGVNGLTSIAAFWQNAMYGILYAYVPEVIPAPSRGTGDALAAVSSRITGIFAPVIAVYGSTSATIPVYISAGIFILTGLVMLLLPFEPTKLKGGAL